MARELTTVEQGLDSFAIRSAVARADKRAFSTEDYGALKAGAKIDAEKLLGEWRDDTSLAEVIAQHVDVNSLAQAINYHALIHAGQIGDENGPYNVCPVCKSLLP